jgi:hypothetical protein
MSSAAATLPSYSFTLTKPRASLRERIARFGQTIFHDEQVEAPIRHYFAPGLFAREISIRAGCRVVGAVHKEDSLIVLSKGRLVMATDDGPQVISAPHTRLCKAGSQNAVYILEDCVWTNFHPNPDNETDIAVLVQRYTETTVDQLLGGKNNAQALAAAQRHAEIEASP